MTAPSTPGPPDVVFVSSLGHSGSTLLERALATHPDLVGLGEVHQLLRTIHDREDVDGHPCGCGAAVRDCPLWSTVVARLRERRVEPADGYRVVLQSFHEVLGDRARPVDSSKSGAALRDLLATGAQVAAVDLVRDVRSWTVAMRDRAVRRRHDEQHRPRGPRAVATDRLAATPWALFATWHRMNEARRAELRRTGVPVVAVGYEPLVAAPGVELARILAGLGLDPAGASADGDLATATSHTIFGNNMKLSADLTRRVRVDDRWLARTEWQLPALLLRSTMRDNRAWVHGVAPAPPFGR